MEYLFSGLTLGMVYALIAVGYSLVFGVLRLVNFSHGAVYAFGSHMVLLFISLKFGLVAGITASIITTGILGIVIEKAALQPLRKKKSPPMAALITTIGISYIIQNLLMIFWGSEKKTFPQLFDSKIITMGDISINSIQIYIFLIALILLLALTIIVHKTKIGLAIRGIEQNQKAANLMGINVNRTVSFVFFLSGVSAAISGILISSYYQIVYPTMGVVIGLKAFAAAVLGGIGILYGSVIGGLLVGVSESFATVFFGGGYRDSISFIILIAILIFRPNGLFGKKGVNKV